jgi:plastocyanin
MRNRIIATINICLQLVLGMLLYGCSTPVENPTPKSYTVEINAMRFQPSELSVQKGDTVVFINNDMLAHNITEQETKAWASSPLSTGQSFNLVVSESADYYCTIHPVMKGKISVK